MMRRFERFTGVGNGPQHLGSPLTLTYEPCTSLRSPSIMVIPANDHDWASVVLVVKRLVVILRSSATVSQAN